MTSIPASEIVNVTPNVLAAGGLGLALNGLFLDQSSRIPIGSVQIFDSADAVATYFGLGSSQAALASVYFLGYDNSTVKPGAMLWAQYNAAAAAAYLRGGNISALALASLQAISGTLIVNADGYVRTAGSLNLSSAVSFSSAAALIQTALNGSPTTIASFTGVIASTTLTTTAVTGTLAPGQLVVGAGVTANTRIVSQLGGTIGGAGTYQVSISQTVGSESMTTTGVPVAVTYDSVAGAFVITSGITGTISSVAFATGTTAANLLLTSATGAVLSQGAAAATPAVAMNTITAITQNWATFTTTFDPDNGSGNTNKLAFATWTNGEDNRYAYVCWDNDASPTTTVPATGSLGYILAQADTSGTILIYSPNTNGNVAAFVCGALASLDFNATNGRATLAFRNQSGLAPEVVNQTVADNLISNGYNFYGAYATAADQFVFLYPGSITGPFDWADSYVNQIWMNSNFQLALMLLLTQAGSVPYNAAGRAMIEASVGDVINAAVNFGAIRSGVTLSSLQVVEVNAAAGQNIAPTLQTRGWYFQVRDAAPSVRQVRGSPPCNFWYCDGQSVQKINLASIELQ